MIVRKAKKNPGQAAPAEIQITLPAPADIKGSQQIQDPFIEYYESNDLLAPKYNQYVLADTVENSDVLPAIIKALAVNVEGFGFDLVPLVDKDHPLYPKVEAEVLAEKTKLDLFFKYCGFKEKFNMIRHKTRIDLGNVGNGYWEIIRDTKGDIAGIKHMSPCITRMHSVLSRIWTKREMIDQNFQKLYVNVQDDFRLYAQIVNNELVWFKELGDPRVISKVDGKTLSDTPNPSISDQANEIIHFKTYSLLDLYGVAEWVGNYFPVESASKAHILNWMHFDNKGIPPMVILLSGGYLYNQKNKELKEVLEKKIKGLSNWNNVLVLQAAPFEYTNDSGGTTVSDVKIDFKPLTQFIEKEGMFQNLIENCRKFARIAHRMPPIFLGMTEDYSFATAFTSMLVGENQVFGPARMETDDVINNILFPEMSISYWEYRGRGPTLIDQLDKAKSYGSLFSTGAFAVNEIRTITNKIFQESMPLSEHPNANTPLFFLGPAPMATQISKMVEDDEYLKTHISKIINLREALEKAE
jgi:PBSX family phage portal protein